MNMDEIASRITLVRTELHLTQKEFADKLGMGQSTINMIERGQRKVSKRHIKAICSVYNVNEDWLCSGKGKMFTKNDVTLIKRLKQEYELTDEETELLSVFLELPKETRQSVLDFGHVFIQKVLEKHQKSADEMVFDAETARLHKMLDEQRQLEKEESIASSASISEKHPKQA